MSGDLRLARRWCALAYLVAVLVGASCWLWLPIPSPWWRMVVADVIATLVIFIFSLGLNNSSFYDPYWSVAPIALAVGWCLLDSPANPRRQLLVGGLIAVWGMRLTYNWLRHWKGLQHEDWRYVDFRRKTGQAYWLLSLFGLHLFPTLMVIMACGSMYVTLALGDGPPNWLDAVAAIITAGAITIETVADKQLHQFVKRNEDPQRFLESGIWAYSRHPNYFGEVMFWWGLWLFGMAADSSLWWTVFGPLAMTAMFLFVSIPLIDERMLRKRPGYAAHRHRVSRLVPWFRLGE